ncbi:hypothetical protein JTE90_026042 [Oedothorax gibbosus]|uniref:Uncharacterized protein n=1 Tax=Oedothorax gibbosus TaxID=931172 RepID=A0AAV6UBZ3_9ARAC|nr:hypothetical protein JTE90_026042 [Oedothorax gibbosus]
MNGYYYILERVKKKLPNTRPKPRLQSFPIPRRVVGGYSRKPPPKIPSSFGAFEEPQNSSSHLERSSRGQTVPLCPAKKGPNFRGTGPIR